MKNLRILFILLLISTFCFYSCKEEVEPVLIFEAGDQKFGWAKGTKEGHQWEASGYWRYHASDSTLLGIDFNTYTLYGALRESYAFNEIPFEEGRHIINGSTSEKGDGFVGGRYARLADDGDAVIGIIYPNDNEDGFITITEIDTLSNTIKGFFEIYFASEDGGLKIEIKDGEFELGLYEE